MTLNLDGCEYKPAKNYGGAHEVDFSNGNLTATLYFMFYDENKNVYRVIALKKRKDDWIGRNDCEEFVTSDGWQAFVDGVESKYGIHDYSGGSDYDNPNGQGHQVIAGYSSYEVKPKQWDNLMVEWINFFKSEGLDPDPNYFCVKDC
jgi:hypothetical protein